MPFECEYDAQTDSLMVKMIGKIDMQTIQALMSEVISASDKHNPTCILKDAREAKPSLGTFDLYEIPRLLDRYIERSHPFFRMRRAIVIAEQQEDYEFFSTVSANVGQRVRIFTDINEAKKWLFEG